MTRLYLIRHGENLDGQLDGRGPTVDLGLTESGREQVRRLCKRLQSDSSLQPTALLSSPERRAEETARAIARALELPLTLDSRLEEWRSDDGSMPHEEFMAQWRALRDVDRAYHRFQPQSETQAEFFARAGEALQSAARNHRGGSVLIVTCGSPSLPAALMSTMPTRLSSAQ